MIKIVGSDTNSSTIAAGRCFFGLILLLPMVVRNGIRELASVQLKLHLLRGVFVAVGINLGFYSLIILPITTVTVLFFTAPLFVTLLAKPILAEKVGWRRIIATLVGFLGAVVVINPMVESIDIRLLMPIISSVFFSVSLVLHKKLSKTDPPWVLMFYMFSATLVFTLPFTFSSWQPISANSFIFILLIAVFATLRTYSDIKGYSTGEVSFVAPFQYLRLLFVGTVLDVQ